MSDWIYNLVEVAITSGFLVAIIEMVRWRKEDKAKKGAEATTATTEAQEKQIDLGSKYFTEMLEMVEQVKGLTEKGNGNQDLMMSKLDTLVTRTDKQDVKLANIETYLNGNYHKWLEERKEAQ